MVMIPVRICALQPSELDDAVAHGRSATCPPIAQGAALNGQAPKSPSGAAASRLLCAAGILPPRLDGTGVEMDVCWRMHQQRCFGDVRGPSRRERKGFDPFITIRVDEEDQPNVLMRSGAFGHSGYPGLL